VVKVIWQQAASPQWYSPGPPVWGAHSCPSWIPHLMHASKGSRVQISNCISTSSAVSAQLTTESPYTLQWATLTLSKLHLPTGWSRPHLSQFPWAHPSPQPKWYINWFCRFCIVHHSFGQLTADYPYNWQRAAFPVKIAPSHGGSGPPSNIWFTGPTWVLKQMASWLVQLFLQGSLPFDRQTMLFGL